jgi:hypothetical protein
VSDLVTNVVGAILGTAIRSRWAIHRPGLPVNRKFSLIAALVLTQQGDVSGNRSNRRLKRNGRSETAHRFLHLQEDQAMDGNTTVQYPPMQRERDSRIDLVRGLALLIIFVDHNAFLDQHAFGWLAAYTLGRISFIDAADVFFFISGTYPALYTRKSYSSRGRLLV